MIKQFATVTVWVEDFPSAITFYRDGLGLELVSRPGDIPQFLVGDSMLVLVKGRLFQPADAFPPDFPLFSFSVDNLEKTVRDLEKLNITLAEGITERPDSRWISLRDPAGNLIEIIEVKP